eukprot:4509266-Prymnesium_polylepis.1
MPPRAFGLCGLCSYDPQRPIYSGNATNHPRPRQSSHHAVWRKTLHNAENWGIGPRVEFYF